MPQESEAFTDCCGSVKSIAEITNNEYVGDILRMLTDVAHNIVFEL